MAKTKSKASHGSSPYILAAILMLIIYVANTVLVRVITTNTTKISQMASKSMNSLNMMNSELQTANIDALHLVLGIGDAEDTDEGIKRTFNNIRKSMENFESIDDSSAKAVKRYEHAKLLIQTYEERLREFTENVKLNKSASNEELKNYYIQNIYPLQVTSAEMLTSTIEIVTQDTAEGQAKIQKTVILLMGVMFLIAVAGEITILIIARAAKKARLEIEEREKNLAEVDAKLRTTRQKASDLAVINVLTGLKNRYALDNDISERLETGRFQVAVFDMDNFRSINDTYGYDFGDEYLAAVAEKIKESFSDVAEIYNITGNEFCFVFNTNISESQAVGISQNIQQTISSPYSVLNLNVQLTCSGAVYHYLPGDCLNVNSLLVKLDTAMRNAKLNGGNMITKVMSI